MVVAIIVVVAVAVVVLRLALLVTRPTKIQSMYVILMVGFAVVILEAMLALPIGGDHVRVNAIYLKAVSPVLQSAWVSTVTCERARLDAMY
jgi:hypothetical protein